MNYFCSLILCMTVFASSAWCSDEGGAGSRALTVPGSGAGAAAAPESDPVFGVSSGYVSVGGGRLTMIGEQEKAFAYWDLRQKEDESLGETPSAAPGSGETLAMTTVVEVVAATNNTVAINDTAATGDGMTNDTAATNDTVATDDGMTNDGKGSGKKSRRARHAQARRRRKAFATNDRPGAGSGSGEAPVVTGGEAFALEAQSEVAVTATKTTDGAGAGAGSARTTSFRKKKGKAKSCFYQLTTLITQLAAARNKQQQTVPLAKWTSLLEKLSPESDVIQECIDDRVVVQLGEQAQWDAMGPLTKGTLKKSRRQYFTARALGYFATAVDKHPELVTQFSEAGLVPMWVSHMHKYDATPQKEVVNALACLARPPLKDQAPRTDILDQFIASGSVPLLLAMALDKGKSEYARKQAASALCHLAHLRHNRPDLIAAIIEAGVVNKLVDKLGTDGADMDGAIVSVCMNIATPTHMNPGLTVQCVESGLIPTLVDRVDSLSGKAKKDAISIFMNLSDKAHVHAGLLEQFVDNNVVSKLLSMINVLYGTIEKRRMAKTLLKLSRLKDENPVLSAQFESSGARAYLESDAAQAFLNHSTK